MSFANPQFLWMPIAAIILCVLGYAFGKHQQKKLSAWIQPSLWKSVIPDFSSTVFAWKNITLGLALVLLTLCIARPQWGEREEVIQSKGMDILFLLDLSNSMNAEDVTPSRLKRAQTFIKKSLDLLADDRVGIIGFAGSAYLAAPLTTDFGYIAEVTDSLDPGAIANQGTNIGDAIDVGMKAFERSAEDEHKTSKAFVLISDGEDFGEEATQAAQRLKKFGAGFFALSVGLAEGAPIPLRNDAGILQTYKKDLSGKPIVSRVNKELLAKIADAAGGKFIELVNADDAAYTLAKQLQSFSRDSNKEQRQVTKIDRYPYFLAAAIFFFFLHLCLGYSRRKAKALAAAAVLIIGWVPASEAQTLDSYWNAKKGSRLYQKGEYENSARSYETSRTEDPENPVLQFNEGTAMAKDKRNEEAIHQFQESTKKALSQGDYETAAKSLYNEGITQSEMKNLPEAYNKLTKSIEMAKISNQPELEKKAREAMVSLIEKQKQQSQQQKDQKDQKDKKDQEQKDKKDQQSQNQNGEKDPKDQKDQDGKDDKQKNQKPQTEDGKKRQFKSGTLSKDVAESIMNDLSDREKQLYQKRMKEKRSREVPNEKDW